MQDNNTANDVTCCYVQTFIAHDISIRRWLDEYPNSNQLNFHILFGKVSIFTTPTVFILTNLIVALVEIFITEVGFVLQCHSQAGSLRAATAATPGIAF